MALCLGVASPALAAPTAEVLRDTPCKGCLVALPSDRAGNRPLLVVLHGDDGSAVAAMAPWKTAARDAGVVLFAPLCPRDLGCTGSYWRWDGPVSWLTQQIDALEQTTPIDRSHVVLAGWSGGASWLGLKGGGLARAFSGLAFEGGGIPPADRSCPACLPRVHYLAGDRNPLHHLEIATKDWLAGCGAEVVWEPLPRRDHAGEAAVLASPGTTSRILTTLLATPGPCGASVAPAASSSSAAPAAASSAVPSAPTPPVASASAPPGPSASVQPAALPPPVGGRCGCATVPFRDARSLSPFALVWVMAAWRRRVVLPKHR